MMTSKRYIEQCANVAAIHFKMLVDMNILAKKYDCKLSSIHDNIQIQGTDENIKAFKKEAGIA